jgi:hypothetical protein
MTPILQPGTSKPKALADLFVDVANAAIKQDRGVHFLLDR